MNMYAQIIFSPGGLFQGRVKQDHQTQQCDVSDRED